MKAKFVRRNLESWSRTIVLFVGAVVAACSTAGSVRSRLPTGARGSGTSRRTGPRPVASAPARCRTHCSRASRSSDAEKANIKNVHTKYEAQMKALREQFKPQMEAARAARQRGDTAVLQLCGRSHRVSASRRRSCSRPSATTLRRALGRESAPSSTRTSQPSSSSARRTAVEEGSSGVRVPTSRRVAERGSRERMRGRAGGHVPPPRVSSGLELRLQAVVSFA